MRSATQQQFNGYFTMAPQIGEGPLTKAKCGARGTQRRTSIAGPQATSKDPGTDPFTPVYLEVRLYAAGRGDMRLTSRGPEATDCRDHRCDCLEHRTLSASAYSPGQTNATVAFW